MRKVVLGTVTTNYQSGEIGYDAIDKAAKDVNPFWDQINQAALQHSFKDIKLKLSDGTSLGITPAILKRKL